MLFFIVAFSNLLHIASSFWVVVWKILHISRLLQSLFCMWYELWVQFSPLLQMATNYINTIYLKVYFLRDLRYFLYHELSIHEYLYWLLLSYWSLYPFIFITQCFICKSFQCIFITGLRYSCMYDFPREL